MRVLERSQDIHAPSAGMLLSPNMSKILRRWAGDDSLDKISRQNLHSPWYDGTCYLPCDPARQT